MVVPALFHLKIKNSTLFLRDLKLKKVLAFLSKLRNFKNLHISYQSDYFKKQLLKILSIFKAIQQLKFIKFLLCLIIHNLDK